MKIAVVDIDGVLNYYPKTWLTYLEKEQGLVYDTLMDAKRSISYSNYKRLKDKYRQSKYKHDAEVREDARRLLLFLHQNNYLIYIATARPLFKFDLLKNTIKWLQKNELYYDYIYCTQKKDFTIFEKFGHVDIVIEDNCDNISKIKEINGNDCKYYIVNNEDNREYLTDVSVRRVDELNTIMEDLLHEI